MHTSHCPVWNTKYVRLPSHVLFCCSRISLLLVLLFYMVINTACLGQGIFLNSRRVEERAVGESRINFPLEQAALPPQKWVLENSVNVNSLNTKNVKPTSSILFQRYALHLLEKRRQFELVQFASLSANMFCWLIILLYIEINFSKVNLDVSQVRSVHWINSLWVN